MNRNINFELYKIFASVVQNGSITNAAKELYISQPAVSQSIKQLETQLGGKLFNRTPKGMELTAEGSAIYEYIERANGLLETAQARFLQMKSLERGGIKIGASDNICRNFLLPFVEKFRAAYPKIKLMFLNGTSSQTTELLKTGKVDIGFVNLPIPGDEILSEPVGELHDCFVAGEAFSHLKDKPIPVKELLNYPVVLLGPKTTSRSFIDEFFKSQDCAIEPSIEVGSHDLLVSFAKKGMGISCVTEEFVNSELASGKLFKLNIDGSVRSRKIGMVYLKETTPAFAVQKFAEMLRAGIAKAGQ